MVSKRRKPQACVTWRLRTGYLTRWRGLKSHLIVSHACISIDLTLLLLVLLSNVRCLTVYKTGHITFMRILSSLNSQRMRNMCQVKSVKGTLEGKQSFVTLVFRIIGMGFVVNKNK